MRTVVYIDGFNLYYSALRGTNYKWLDVVRLFTNICQQQNPSSELVKIKLFTSPISAKLSTRGTQAQNSQRIYLNALNKLYPDTFECVEGFFSVTKGTMPVFQNPINRLDRVDVWRIEEKKTDVSMALSVYRDVIQHDLAQVVIVTSDSDIVPALEFIRSDYPSVQIGTITPFLNNTEATPRNINRSLADLSNWSRRGFSIEEVVQFQLPVSIPTLKKPIRKPSYW